MSNATNTTAAAAAEAGPFLMSNMGGAPLLVAIGGLVSWLWYAVPWTLALALTPLCGVRLRVVSDEKVLRCIKRRVAWYSHAAVKTEESAAGWCGGAYFIAHISPASSSKEESMWMLSTNATWARVSTIHPAVSLAPRETDPRTSVALLTRWGSPRSWAYGRRVVKLNVPAPTSDQARILDLACAHFARKRCTVLFVDGPPGTGKSMLGLMLASRLGGAYCSTCAPWEPGDSIERLWMYADPTRAAPLVLAFDEIDTVLLRIHDTNRPALSEKTATQVANKAGWNLMLDTFARGLYPEVVIVMTSNTPRAVLDALDASYLRSGRVDVHTTLSHKPDKPDAACDAFKDE